MPASEIPISNKTYTAQAPNPHASRGQCCLQHKGASNSLEIGKSCELPVLKLLFVITAWERASDVSRILENDDVLMFFQFMAEGTANSEILDILGLGGTDKAVTICVLPEPVSTRLMADVSLRMSLSDAGSGISFIMPLSGASKISCMLLKDETFKNSNRKIEREAKKMEMGLDRTHDLIIAAIKRGYSSLVMDCARHAGATGGTVIHARQMGAALSSGIAGIQMSEEKEIVMILAEKEIKMNVMSAVNKSCGLASEAQGIVISLPVDAVMGV